MRIAALSIAVTLCAAGASGCSSPPHEDVRTGDYAIDGAALTITRDARGLIDTVSGVDGRGVLHEIEAWAGTRYQVREADDGEAIVREYLTTRVDFREGDRLALTVTSSFAPWSKMVIVRAFSGPRTMSCTLDFSHMHAAGYGIVTRRVYEAGKLANFETSHWGANDAAPKTGCDIESIVPNFAAVTGYYGPFLRANADTFAAMSAASARAGRSLATPALAFRADRPGLDFSLSPMGHTDDELGFEAERKAKQTSGLNMSAEEKGVWRSAFIGGALAFGTIEMSCKGSAVCIGASTIAGIWAFIGILASGYNTIETDAEKAKEAKSPAGPTSQNGINTIGDDPGGYHEPSPADVGYPGGLGDGAPAGGGGAMAGGPRDRGADGDRYNGGGDDREIGGCGHDFGNEETGIGSVPVLRFMKICEQ